MFYFFCIICVFYYFLIQYRYMTFEENIIKFLQTNASVGWISLFQIITLFGSYLGFIIIFCILFFKERKLSYAFAITFVIASVINQILKLIIARDRPFVNNYEIINYGGEDGYSMPSGHSVCGGLFATFMIYSLIKQSKYKLTKILGTIFWVIFPFLIAFSRMVLGVHYLSDTLVGIVIGVISAIIGIVIYNFVTNKFLNKNNNNHQL